MVDPSRAIGRLTLKTEVIDDSASSRRNVQGDDRVTTGKQTTTRPAPSRITPPTYSRARGGRLFIDWNFLGLPARDPFPDLAGAARAPPGRPVERRAPYHRFR